MGDFAKHDNPKVQAELNRLDLIGRGEDSLGLRRITTLLDRLSDPHLDLPPVFHVAGTNGKGSTIAMLRAGLEAAGKRVHVFTSPHLVRFNERIRIAGKLIDDDELAALLKEVREAATGLNASFFEVTAAAAFLAFSRHDADACLIEVGLGGRLDATNVVPEPAVTGIASLGIDHQHFLGETLAEIAAEKAGIARAGVPLVALAQRTEAANAIQRIADKVGAPLHLEGRDWSLDAGLDPSLDGPHQLRNANLAWQMLISQKQVEISRDQFRDGLKNTIWPARFQKMAAGPLTAGDETYVDGAHNEDAARALADLLAGREKMHIVMGILANKDAEKIVAALLPHALTLTFVPVTDHEHHQPIELARRFGGAAASSLAEALASLPAPRLVAGSLYVAGEALALNDEAPN